MRGAGHRPKAGYAGLTGEAHPEDGRLSLPLGPPYLVAFSW
jgi:hypothetical protein